MDITHLAYINAMLIASRDQLTCTITAWTARRPCTITVGWEDYVYQSDWCKPLARQLHNFSTSTQTQLHATRTESVSAVLRYQCTDQNNPWAESISHRCLALWPCTFCSDRYMRICTISATDHIGHTKRPFRPKGIMILTTRYGIVVFNVPLDTL